MSELSPAGLQPLLHDLSTCVRAPLVALSESTGQIRPVGAQGLFSADLRIISRAELTVESGTGQPVALEAVSVTARGGDGADYIAVLRGLTGPNPDPSVWLRRERRLTTTGMAETLVVRNVSPEPVILLLRLDLAADLAGIEAVKTGQSWPARAALAVGGDLIFATDTATVTISAPLACELIDGQRPQAGWRLEVPGRSDRSAQWSVTFRDSGAVMTSPPAPGPSIGGTLTVEADDRRLGLFVRRSLADLNCLRMATVREPQEVFLAAGSPWYLTLFGRDSLWAARMLLPFGWQLAAGTLRTLADRQGTVVDQATAQQPGKMLHEVRRRETGAASAFLPPVYFGTIDATPLWISLLADSWRWGMPADQVRALLPNLDRAMAWIEEFADSDGDGFAEYLDETGAGLANQGWKDSGDSVRFADGRVAVGPVALSEVQGYLYRAALDGAELLETFGRGGTAKWREHAARLATRFRESFWAADELGRYPVLALDGRKQQVDAPTSNMGHLLATGILSPEEAGSVAQRLVHPSMSSGFGLRTMSTETGGYSPFSYHCGSVWPHDTAIAIHGLISSGHRAEAATLVNGLLAAGAAFDGRLPELYAGFSIDEQPTPVPYPASCRPQAWSAASAVVLLQAILGLRVDVPAGTFSLNPLPEVGALRITGLPIGGHPADIEVGADGSVLGLAYGGPLVLS